MGEKERERGGGEGKAGRETDRGHWPPKTPRALCVQSRGAEYERQRIGHAIQRERERERCGEKERERGRESRKEERPTEVTGPQALLELCVSSRGGQSMRDREQDTPYREREIDRQTDREKGMGEKERERGEGKAGRDRQRSLAPEDSSSSVCPAEEGLAIAPPRTGTQIV